jgi:hypothetical protein
MGGWATQGFDVESGLVETRELRNVNPRGDFFAFIAPDINHDAPLRFERLAPHMTDRQYWRLLATLWVYTDTPHPYLPVWRRLFRAPRPGRERHLMYPNERALLRGLPARVELHRGFEKVGGEAGIAWTRDIEMAHAFAERWVGYTPEPDDGLFVATVTVPRERVVACFERESMPGVECVVPSRRGYPSVVRALASR